MVRHAPGQIEVILVDTRHAGNIGAVARLLKNLDLPSLTLVNPTPRAHLEAIKMAVGAEQIIEQAKIVETLDEALASCSQSWAVTRRPRRSRKIVFSLDEAAEQIRHVEGTTGLVFGSEKQGLSNQQIARCGSIITIPVSTVHGSYNLAQAAAITLYQVANLWLGMPRPNKRALREPAKTIEKRILYDRMVETFAAAGFFGRSNDAKVVASIEDIFERARLDRKDVRILLGVGRRLRRSIAGGKAAPTSEKKR